MTIETSLKSGINPPPSKEERKRARDLMKIAFSNVKNKPPRTTEETIKDFEELRKDIINQCQKNDTL